MLLLKIAWADLKHVTHHHCDLLPFTWTSYHDTKADTMWSHMSIHV